MKFDQFQQVNRKRLEEAFHEIDDKRFPLVFWTNAICGEAGELANTAKKIARGDFAAREDAPKAYEALAKEIADVIIYCDLLCSFLGLNTAMVVAKKFDEVSNRVRWDGERLWELPK